MEDKEVGDLHREAMHLRATPIFDGGCLLKVIGKLVDERAKRSYSYLLPVLAFDSALRDFGIDPETFEEPPHGEKANVR